MAAVCCGPSRIGRPFSASAPLPTTFSVFLSGPANAMTPRGVAMTPRYFPVLSKTCTPGLEVTYSRPWESTAIPSPLPPGPKDCEIAAVGQRARVLHVERNEGAAVGDVESPIVEAEGNSVGAEVIGRHNDSPRAGIIEAAGREIRAAVAIGQQIIDARLVPRHRPIYRL